MAKPLLAGQDLDETPKRNAAHNPAAPDEQKRIDLDITALQQV